MKRYGMNTGMPDLRTGMNNREWNRILPGKCRRKFVLSSLAAGPWKEEFLANLMETYCSDIRHYASL